MNSKNKRIHPDNISLLGPPKNGEKYEFEECLSLIQNEIARRKPRWLLERIISYEDCSQILQIIFFHNFNQLDQSRPILNWINKTITNRTCNIIRDVWSNFCKPCSKCSASEGTDYSCRIYGTQNSECPLYAKWEKSKKNKQSISMAESFDEIGEVLKTSLVCQNNFQEYNVEKFHTLIKPLLTPFQYKVYDLFYIQGLDDKEVADKLGYKPSKSGSRPNGYKSILKMKKIFMEKAREVIAENDLS